MTSHPVNQSALLISGHSATNIYHIINSLLTLLSKTATNCLGIFNYLVQLYNFAQDHFSLGDFHSHKHAAVLGFSRSQSVRFHAPTRKKLGSDK